MFYLLVAGSRTFNDYQLLEQKLNHLLQNKQEVCIVSGGARGADTLAEKYATTHGCELIVMKAEWQLYGKSAGYRRNEAMHSFIAQHSDRGCVCFWDGSSKGTAHNFELCKKYGTPLRVVRF